jgi:pSer/pThr/pTyr-binding forkhead associated (FHA) protein
MPGLKMLRGPEVGRVYELTDDTVTIGRGRRNEVIIHDNEVSREHCRLVKVLFDYEIHDLESTNGTYLNGRPVGNASTPLFDKNIIELGDSIVLEYIASREAIPTPDPSPPLIPVVVKTPIAQDIYLVLRRKGHTLPEVYLLDSPVVDIGRHLDNTICLAENQVSRFHMRLNRIDDHYNIEDLGSVNGTMLNGKRVDHAVDLKFGDYIAIGQMVEMWYTNDLETLQMIPYSVEQAAAASKKTEEFKQSALAAAAAAHPEPAVTKESAAVVAKATSESSAVDAPTDQVPRREPPKVEAPDTPSAPETTVLDPNKVNLPDTPSQPKAMPVLNMNAGKPTPSPSVDPTIIIRPDVLTRKPDTGTLSQETAQIKPTIEVPPTTPEAPAPVTEKPETPSENPASSGVAATIETFAAPVPSMLPPAPAENAPQSVPETRRFAPPPWVKPANAPATPVAAESGDIADEPKAEELPATKEVPSAPVPTDSEAEAPLSSNSPDLAEPKE